MSALIVSLSLGLALQLGGQGSDEPQAASDDVVAVPFDAAQDPVILKTQQRQPARRQPARRATRAKTKAPKNGILSCFWNVFSPPGDYTMELGLSGGLNFLETAYGGSNPNIMGRLQGAYRFNPDLPIQVFGALDYSGYSQDAGPLDISSRFLTLAAGGGLVYWISALKLDLGAELGALMRLSSLSDGKGTDETNFAMQPVASVVGGLSFGLAGHVSLSLKGIARARTDRDFSFGAFDYSVLYGLEWYIDAKPKKIY